MLHCCGETALLKFSETPAWVELLLDSDRVEVYCRLPVWSWGPFISSLGYGLKHADWTSAGLNYTQIQCTCNFTKQATCTTAIAVVLCAFAVVPWHFPIEEPLTRGQFLCPFKRVQGLMLYHRMISLEQYYTIFYFKMTKCCSILLAFSVHKISSVEICCCAKLLDEIVSCVLHTSTFTRWMHSTYFGAISFTVRGTSPRKI